MKVTQKVLISLLIAIVLFTAFAIAAFSGLYDLIDARFYDQRVRDAGRTLLQEAQETTLRYQEEMRDEIVALVDLPAIRNVFLINQSRQDTEDQARAIGELFDRRPEIEFIRVFDNNAGQLWFSTLEEDVRSRTDVRIEYRPIGELVPEPGLPAPDEEDTVLSWRSERGALRIVVPVVDAFDIPRGILVAWVRPTGLYARLLEQNLVGPSARVQMSPGGLIVYNARRHFMDEDLAAIDRVVQSSDVLPLLQSDLGENYAIEYRDPESPAVPPGVFLINERDLHMDQGLRVILLAAVFVVGFLLSYLILNLRQEPAVVVTERFRRFQQAVLRDYLREGRAIEPDLWKRELTARREQIEGELKRGVGRLNEERRAQVEQEMGRRWEELYRLLGSQTNAKTELEPVSLAQIEAIIERTLARHGSIVSAEPTGRRGTTPTRQSREPVGPTGPVEPIDVDDLEPLEEIEEVEAISDNEAAGPFAGMRPVEVETIEDDEESADIEEIETTEAEDGPYAGMRPVEVETISEDEELEALEEIEEAPTAHEAVEAEDLESGVLIETEEPGEVEELEELEAEELAEAEELEALEEIEEAEEAEELAEVEELEDLEAEELTEAEELEALEEIEEAEEAEELTEFEELEDLEAEEPAVAEEPAEVEELEDLEAEELTEAEELEALEEIEEAEEAEELTEAEELEALEEISEATPLEEVAESWELEDRGPLGEQPTELFLIDGTALEKAENQALSRAADRGTTEELPAVGEDETELEELEDLEYVEERVQEIEAVHEDETAIEEVEEIPEAEEVEELTEIPEIEQEEYEDLEQLEEVALDTTEVVNATEIGSSISSFFSAAGSFGGRAFMSSPTDIEAAESVGRLAVFHTDELRKGPVRIRGVENVSSYHVTEIDDFISVIGRNREIVERHRGTFRIRADAYNQETSGLDAQLFNLSDQVINRRDIGSIDDIFGDTFGGLDFGDVLSDDTRAPVSDAEWGLRLGSDGFVFAAIAETGDVGMRQVYRGLVRLTRRWDARVAVILELDEDDNARGIYSLGMPEECEDQLGLASSTNLVRNVLSFRRVCLLKEPLVRYQGYEASCSAHRLTALTNWLFLPLQGPDRIRYLVVGFPKSYEDLIDLSSRLQLLSRGV